MFKEIVYGIVAGATLLGAAALWKLLTEASKDAEDNTVDRLIEECPLTTYAYNAGINLDMKINRAETVTKILDELKPYYTNGMVKFEFTNERSEAKPDYSFGTPLNERKYVVKINPNRPTSENKNITIPVSDNLKQSAYNHELTHISNDLKYSFNAGDETDIANFHKADDNIIAGLMKIINTRCGQLIKLIEKDLCISKCLRDYLIMRISYIENQKLGEVDTVLNELTTYLHLEEIPIESIASQEITRWASERYDLRNNNRV